MLAGQQRLQAACRDLPAVEEDKTARQTILAQGCEILELTEDEHTAFAAAVQPLLVEDRETYGQKMFDLLAREIGAGNAGAMLWRRLHGGEALAV